MFRKLSFWLLVAIIIVAAGGGYAYYRKSKTTTQVSSEPVMQTAVARRGSLVISAMGSGSVIPAAQVELAFTKSGRLSELSVQVGDVVKAGDVLAVLESSESATSLEAQLRSAEMAVLKAQKNLDDLNTPVDAMSLAQTEVALAQAQKALDNLLSPSESSISQAKIAVIEAQDNVNSAQHDMNNLTYGRGNVQQINLARANYLLAQDKVDQLEDAYAHTPGDPETDANKAMALSNLEGAKTARNQKLAILNWYQGKPSDVDLAKAQTNLDLTNARLAEAQQALEDLLSPSEIDLALAKAQVEEQQQKLNQLKAGPDATDVEIAESELINAQAQLAIKQDAMKSESLIAPINGTILAVNAAVGDNVGTNPIITLADLSVPKLEIFVDETDLNQIGKGYEVEVTFDALPDQTFTGRVLSMDPSLTSADFVRAVRAIVQLDEGSFAKPQSLPVGLNASVEVIGSRAENVVLVPVEALREIASGKYSVFVLVNGQPMLRTVEVGLMDFTYAEIKSGVEAGETVTTGVVETGQ